MAAAFGVCVLVGGIMVRVAEGRITDRGQSRDSNKSIAAG
jgi:hypothetical protein